MSKPGGPTVSSTDKKGHTPLMYAARNGHFEMCKLLIAEYGADVLSSDSSGQLVFHDSIQAGNLSTFKYLLSETEKAR